MWQGDPFINAYMSRYVAPELLRRHGVELKIVSGQGSAIVSILMTEKEAGRAKSGVDVVWINGETFYQLRQIDGLYGPFTGRLPDARAIDFGNRFIRYDFQQEVKGYECPWGNVQLSLIYDSRRVSDPPRTKEALARWVEAHPGRFTLDTGFTGLTFLKSLLIDVAGGERALAGRFDRARYDHYAPALWRYVNGIKRWFWKRGETFPSELAQEHQMFANGELDFTMSNNDGEVDNKVRRGLFPESARAYVLDTGTIQNSHYLGIVKNAPHLEGALVAIDFLISPAAQLEKAKPDVWGDGTILDIGRLPAPWRARFAELPRRRYGPERSAIESKALMELAPEYMARLHEDFRAQVVEK
jgi:putative spermidine/putrescine transport system substrate-binding protein